MRFTSWERREGEKQFGEVEKDREKLKNTNQTTKPGVPTMVNPPPVRSTGNTPGMELAMCSRMNVYAPAAFLTENHTTTTTTTAAAAATETSSS